MSRKPRILLIPNLAWWIIGEMGKQIIARFGDKYDFYFLPETILERRPDLLRALVPAVDAIHCLNESSLDMLQRYDQATLPPIVTWIHHITEWSPAHQLAIDRSTALTVCTNGWKNYLVDRTAGRIPVTVVPHGVDANFFQLKSVPPGRFGIPAGHFVVGFVGSKGSDMDHGRKGTDVFLHVIRMAAKQIPNLHVVLGGPGWDQELADLKSLGVSASATNFVRKSELPVLYSSFDIFVMTSRIEGGPCTVFEAMACEKPVVATRVGAVPDIIVDGFNGLTADVDDAQSLLAAIVDLHQFPEKRRHLARNARNTVEGRTWAAAMSPLERVYDELVQIRSKTGSPKQGPSWLKDPDALLRASCGAGSVISVLPRVRKGSLGTLQGLRQLSEMISNQSIMDVLKGAAMMRGVAFRTTSAIYPSLAARLNRAIERRKTESLRGLYRRSGPLARLARHPIPLLAPWHLKEIHLMRAKGLGDVLLCTPALREMKRLNPRCRIHFYTEFPALLRQLPYIDEVRLTAEAPAHCIAMQYESANPPWVHLAMILGDELGLKVVDTTPDCIVDSVLVERWKSAWRNLPRPHILTLRRAGEWTPNKNWQDESWVELADSLSRFGTVIDIGSSADHTQLPGGSYVDLRGRTSIESLVAAVAAADLYVGPDSGPMHIAAAVKTPAVVIAGGYIHPRVVQYSGQTYLYTPVPCSPCYLQTPCPFSLKCLAAIHPDQVERLVRECWAADPRQVLEAPPRILNVAF